MESYLNFLKDGNEAERQWNEVIKKFSYEIKKENKYEGIYIIFIALKVFFYQECTSLIS